MNVTSSTTNVPAKDDAARTHALAGLRQAVWEAAQFEKPGWVANFARIVAREVAEEDAVVTTLDVLIADVRMVALDLADNGMHPEDAAEYLARAIVKATDAAGGI